MSLTIEQQAVVDFAVGTERHLVVEAGAGTGKTTTIMEMCAAMCRKGRREGLEGKPRRAGLGVRGLYTTFTKAMIEDADRKLKANWDIVGVEARTMHAVANSFTGAQFRDRKEGSDRGEPSWAEAFRETLRCAPFNGVKDSAESAARPEPVKLDAYNVGVLARMTVERFTESADTQLGFRHVPTKQGVRRTDGYVRHIYAVARMIWSDWSDPAGQLPFRNAFHRVYLKLFQLDQLTSPSLHEMYDFIVVDEAQDVTAVMMSIIEAQAERVQIVAIGDSQQEIFGWAGASNSLAKFRGYGWDSLAITHSFRFGPAIAAVANSVLDYLGAELRIVGAGPADSEASSDGSMDGTRAVLCRSNATVIETLIELLDLNVKAHAKVKHKEIADWCEAALKLMRGEKPWGHYELNAFDSWDDVLDYVEYGDDIEVEFATMVNLIVKFTPETIIDALARQAAEGHADVIVITAHKSKGLEWDDVLVAQDFTAKRLGGELAVIEASANGGAGLPTQINAEECRLAYVAATRARKRLRYGRSTAIIGAIQFAALGTEVALAEPDMGLAA